MNTDKHNKFEQLCDKTQAVLNQTAVLATTLHPENTGIMAISIVISVINEVMNFINGQIVEDRLQELEMEIISQGIELEELKGRIDSLNLHEQIVLRNNMKEYCLSALPETTGIRTRAMLAYIMSEKHEFEEEICEIVRELNAKDVETILILKKAVSEKNGILWGEFLKAMSITTEISSDAVLCAEFVNETGEEVHDMQMICRSLLKLQRLGVVDIRSNTYLGMTSTNMIEAIELTAFGRRIVGYLDE